MDFLPGMNSAMNLHPMFVHFPIALIMTALLVDIMGLVLKKEQYGTFVRLLLNLGAVSAVVALYFGYQASDALGHDAPGHDFVHEHRDVMLWFTWLTVGAAIAFHFLKMQKAVIFRVAVLVVLSALLVVGSDRGARLVYQYGMGVNMMDMSAGEGGDHGAGPDHHGKPEEKSGKKKNEHVHSDGSSHEH